PARHLPPLLVYYPTASRPTHSLSLQRRSSDLCRDDSTSRPGPSRSPAVPWKAGVSPTPPPPPTPLPASSAETSKNATATPSGGSDRKSTRLNSSHVKISYAVSCLKKKTPNSGR